MIERKLTKLILTTDGDFLGPNKEWTSFPLEKNIAPFGLPESEFFQGSEILMDGIRFKLVWSANDQWWVGFGHHSSGAREQFRGDTCGWKTLENGRAYLSEEGTKLT